MRQFFDSLAEKLSFHPTEEPLRWYEVSANDVLIEVIFDSNICAPYVVRLSRYKCSCLS